MYEQTTLEIRKDNWPQTRIVTQNLESGLAEHEVLLKTDRMALTANNISYAAAGDALGYWGFFPAEDGWGRIPVMGWADVLDSAHPEISPGERVWGFFPPSSHLKILAGKVRASGFHDVSPHRSDYAPVYSQFDRASANPIYDQLREDQDSLLRGLYMTSWLVEDFMNVNGAFGAQACLITSASSKTSIALAHSVKRRGTMTTVGLTSVGNMAFCESLGCYDQLVSYQQTADLDAAVAVVLVDMAGSAQVLADAHGHYGNNMKFSSRVGATHYEEMGAVDGLPGATPEFFFAPGHVQTRSKELGGDVLMGLMGAGYIEFRQFCDGWLSTDLSRGSAAVETAYQNVLAGKVAPAHGQIISMRPDGDT